MHGAYDPEASNKKQLPVLSSNTSVTIEVGGGGRQKTNNITKQNYSCRIPHLAFYLEGIQPTGSAQSPD